MSSSVYFKFMSSKEPQRVTFDGTGISVFELKREIISISRLGDGTDFDLRISNDDGTEEYDDDTTIIPRSTSVLARRLPAKVPGKGGAARYVSGKMPANAKNSYRIEQNSMPATATKPSTSTMSGASAMEKAQTEEERIAAMFQVGADQWEQQKQHMASATPVYRPGGVKGKPQVVPEHEPPTGYICYRCGEKGHWIQACPTNNDPTFDGRPRVKRTTGIPRSFLQTIEKPASLVNDGLTDDTRQPSGVMVNAEGEFVVAVPDKASWEQYQAKAQASAALEDVAATGSKELENRGIQCPIDKRMFVDPMKTPCCGKTYCNECIENALINSDLVCPGCSTEGVLFDNLVLDEEMTAKIKAFEEEKKAPKITVEKAESPTPSKDGVKIEKSKSPSPTPSTASKTSTSGSKKRAAEDDLQNPRIPTGPAAMRKAEAQAGPLAGLDPFVEQMNALANGQNPNMNMPMNMNMNMNMSFPAAASMGMVGGFPGMMNPMMGINMNMPQPMMNPMMMQRMMAYPPFGMNGVGMSGMGGMGFPQQQQQQNWQGGMNSNTGGWNQQTQLGSFPNQQFSQPSGNEDDNAYMRKPVNPHRHQGKQRKVRPMDFREL